MASVSVERGKVAGSGVADIEAPEGAKSGEDEPFVYPTPKYVFTIFSPNEIIIGGQNSRIQDQSQLSGSVWSKWAGFAAVSTASSDTSSSGSKKRKIKLRSLVLKMINRLIREQLIPRENVALTTVSAKAFCVQMLISPAALPVLMARCEHIGIGNVVGQCFAIPIETSSCPKPVANQQNITLDQLLMHLGTTKAVETDSTGGDTKLGQSALGASTKTTSSNKSAKNEQSSPLLDEMQKDEEEEDDDAESVSTEGESDQADNKNDNPGISKTVKFSVGGTSSVNSTVPDSVDVPTLTKQRVAELKKKIVAARQEWLQTGSRVRVEQVKEEVTAAATMTWDYIVFVLCAATIAGVGLATNSAVSVVASMLVSPILGPVMGFTFGATIRSKPLVILGLKNEIISVLLCLVVGCIISFLAVGFGVHQRSYPSVQMTSRGEVAGLGPAVIVALASGVATALSTLGRNSSGLVGVAISLSLLPPMVNAGLCLTYAALLNAPNIHRATGDDINYVEYGLVSFALTCINIACIFLAGTFTFWLKEVVPVQHKNAFFSRDLPNYRAGNVGETSDVDVINEGMEAVVELKEAAGATVLDADMNFDAPVARMRSRRRGLASNALEDALYLQADFGHDLLAVTGEEAVEAVDGDSPKKAVTGGKRRGSTAAFFQKANNFGDLANFGVALFDDDIIETVEGGLSASRTESHRVSLPSDTDLFHEDVADQILFEQWKYM